MADDSSTDEELREMSDILEGLDPDMANVLKQIGRIDDAEVEIDLVNGFSKEEISELRMKMFGAAKQKVVRWRHRPNAGGIFGPEHNPGTSECDLLSKYTIDQWEMITRRKKNNFAKDAIDMITFALNPSAVFPARLIKNLSMDKGSLEIVPDAEITALDQLDKDVELAGGDYAVEIVNNTGDAETHLITVETREAIEKDSSECDREHTPPETEPPVLDQDQLEDSKCPCCRERKPDDPLFVLVKSFVQMSEKMMESFMGSDKMMKTAQQYHKEYMEKMARETTNNVKQLLLWQKSVDKRLDNIEKRNPMNRDETCNPWRKSVAERLDLIEGKVATTHEVSDNEVDNPNEPPYDAVSQRSAQEVGRKDTVARKQFPAKVIHETPNPRLPNVAKKGQKGKGTGKKAVNIDTMGASTSTDIVDMNPYAPLAQVHDVEPSNKGRYSTRGRGRNRQQNPMVKPGPIDKQPPKQKERTSTVVESRGPPNPGPREKGNGPKDSVVVCDDHKETSVHKASDISTSWYEEDEDGVDEAAAVADGDHYGSDWIAGADDTSEQNIVTSVNDSDEESSENEPIEVPKRGMEPRNPITRGGLPDNRKQPSGKNTNNRKRTSTREAPVDFNRQSIGVGKSTAPMNKKQKLDKASKGRKPSYAGTMERDKDQWLWAGGKDKKKANINISHIPELKSAAEVSLREIYVQELDCSNCKCCEDFENMVMAYCSRRGLNAVDACTIPVKGSRLKSGCKLTVHDTDYDMAMRREFWPKGTTIRIWKQRPRDDSNEDEDESLSE